MIHQTPRSWDEFREVMLLCSDQIQSLAMDLPGMGASSQLVDPPSIEAYADAAVHLIERLHGGPVIVCGHHTGGVVAMDIAARRPDLVQSLILSSTPWVDAAARKARAQNTSIDTVSRSRDGKHLSELWQQRSPFYPQDLSYMDRFMATALCADSPERGHRAVSLYEMERSSAHIKCPALIVEHMTDPFASRHTADLKRALPHAHIEQIPNGSVALEVTAAEFADILKRWVLRTDDASASTQ